VRKKILNKYNHPIYSLLFGPACCRQGGLGWGSEENI